MAAWRYGIFLLVFNLISLSFAMLTHEIYQSEHIKRSSISPHTHVLAKIPSNSKCNSPSKLDLFAISQKFPQVFSPIPRNSKIFLFYSFACLGISWNS